MGFNSAFKGLTSPLDGGGFNATPGPLYPGKEPRYPLDRSLGETQGRCGRVQKVDRILFCWPCILLPSL